MNFSNSAFNQEILIEKALVEKMELAKLNEGLINYEDYSNGKSQRIQNNKILTKLRLFSVTKKDRKKITADSIYEELKLTKTNLINLADQVLKLTSN